jgi:hypothetical protein
MVFNLAPVHQFLLLLSTFLTLEFHLLSGPFVLLFFVFVVLDGLVFEGLSSDSLSLLLLVLLDSVLKCLGPLPSHEIVLHSSFALIADFAMPCLDSVKSIIQPVCHFLCQYF